MPKMDPNFEEKVWNYKYSVLHFSTMDSTVIKRSRKQRSIVSAIKNIK